MPRGRLGGPGEYTDVSIGTEIVNPWLTWLSLMLFVPLTFIFALGTLWGVRLMAFLSLGKSSFRYWRLRIFGPWWSSLGWASVLVLVILGWLIATFITAYRFWTEQGAKQWKAEYGWWYPGRRIAQERHAPKRSAIDRIADLLENFEPEEDDQ